ncbi:MAG: recombinase family protein [Mycolicibacterium sp.]|uniref:recombinase family protein n=1 Tax=Mycolicibacterium sp. TaxID=2320850 RepID=UPI003D1168CF
MSAVDAPNQQITAACYLRISSDPREKREGVDRQREDCLKLCADRGWTPRVYEDNDISATSGKKRPAYEQMLADVKAGQIQAIVCWRPDRLYRRLRDLLDLMDIVRTHSVPIATVQAGLIDMSTDAGRLIATILGAVAQNEVDVKAARQLRAAEQRAEKGIPKWTRAFGYIDDYDIDGVRQKDPATAPLVEAAYRSILAGESLGSIYKKWNEAGHYGKKGKPWTATTLSLFLRKPRNAGLREYKGVIVVKDGQRVKGKWVPLVDESIWESAQQVLNAPERKPGRKTVRKHKLTGVLRCGKCGAHMVGKWQMQKTGGKSGPPKAGEVKQHPGTLAHKIVYACVKCNGCSVRAEHIEPLLLSRIAARLSQPDARDLLKAQLHDPEKAARLRAETNALLEQIAEANREYDEGIIDGNRLKGRTKRVEEKLAEIERQQQDQDRLRVFDGIPIGTDDAVEAVLNLSEDRLRRVIEILMVPTVMPVGRGHKVFDSTRLQSNWIESSRR